MGDSLVHVSPSSPACKLSGAGIVSFSFLSMCTLPKTLFGSSTAPRERHECLPMGLVSGGRSGLAARTGCCQRAIVAWGVDGCLRKHAGLKRQGMGSNEQAVTEWRRGHRISQEKSWEADVRAKLNCGGRGCHFMESFVCRRGAELRVYVSPVTPTTIL